MPDILYARIEQNDTVWAEITLNRPDKGNALTLPMLWIGQRALGRDFMLRRTVT